MLVSWTTSGSMSKEVASASAGPVAGISKEVVGLMCQRLISRLLSPLKIEAYCVFSEEDSTDSRASAWTPREWPFRVVRRESVEGSQTINVASAEAETSRSFPSRFIAKTALTKSVCPANRFVAVLVAGPPPMSQQYVCLSQHPANSFRSPGLPPMARHVRGAS